MPTPPQVVVVGSFVQDLTWRCADFPQPGQTVVGTFLTGPGGKGSNQAVAAGRAGVPTCFVGAVGRDAFAAEAKKFYKENGIAARFALKAGHPTGTAGILVGDSGQNEIVVALGANARLARADVPERLLAQAKVVVVQLESNLATTAHVLRLARRAGVTTVLNPAPMRPDFSPALLKSTDILVPNETEFTLLVNRLPATGRIDFTEDELAASDPAALHALCRTFGVPVVIITLGRRGCLISRPEGFEAVSAFSVKAVDTTGAGDAFVGGFAAGLVKFDHRLEEAARYGTAVAALSVTQVGTAPSMPWASDVARFLKRMS